MNGKKVIVAPSLLAADPMNFASEFSEIEKGGADWHHVDVMDGHYVPNLTYGLPFIKAMKKITNIPLDVHIMVSNPDEVTPLYIEAGADLLVFHIEAAVHPYRLVQLIKSAGVKAGVAINPGTPLSFLEPLLENIDLINVMSVNPGFGGQKFIESAIPRIIATREMLEKIGRFDNVHIQVDGGINEETGKLVVDAGADVLVAGSWIYGADDRAARIKLLHSLNLRGL